MRGLVAQAVLAAMFVLPGNFESLLACFSVAAWIFYLMVRIVRVVRHSGVADPRNRCLMPAAPLAWHCRAPFGQAAGCPHRNVSVCACLPLVFTVTDGWISCACARPCLPPGGDLPFLVPVEGARPGPAISGLVGRPDYVLCDSIGEVDLFGRPFPCFPLFSPDRARRGWHTHTAL